MLAVPRVRIALVALALAATFAGVAFAVVRGERAPEGAPDYPRVERAAPARAADRPNVVFIYTDDQNYADLNRRYMPRTMRLLGERGTTFSNYVVATPVCCPSRATMLTGAYPHNNGVFSNRDGWGGLEREQSNLGTWMQRAGYRTAWLGKFLQGYERAVGDPASPAPGFDEWLVTVKPKYFGYKLHTNTPRGTITGGDGRADYYTHRLTDEARRLIRKQLPRKRPLFMVLNHLAPHRGDGGRGRCKPTAAPAARDFGRFSQEPLPRPPSFNRVGPGPRSFAGAPLSQRDVRKLAAKFRCRVESLAAVDRSVAAVHRAVRRAGELDNTIFVFTSDNGVMLGEHGLTGKSIPYEEGIRMPLLIRVPERLLGRAPAEQTASVAANVDLAPTLLDLAGAKPCIGDRRCRTLDGRSLVPLLSGREEAWPSDRAIPIEGGKGDTACAYRGVRLASEVLIERVAPGAGGKCVSRGTPEHYRLDSDPYQLTNLASTGERPDRERVAELRRRALALQDCAGIEGRDAARRRQPACE